MNHSDPFSFAATILFYSYKIVIPPEATRDVLAGRVPYLLVEDGGITEFKPVHVFAALKLRKETVHRLENYSCVGAHERFLKEMPKKRIGLGYRRKYISPELIGRGIFVSCWKQMSNHRVITRTIVLFLLL